MQKSEQSQGTLEDPKVIANGNQGHQKMSQDSWNDGMQDFQKNLQENAVKNSAECLQNLGAESEQKIQYLHQNGHGNNFQADLFRDDALSNQDQEQQNQSALKQTSLANDFMEVDHDQKEAQLLNGRIEVAHKMIEKQDSKSPASKPLEKEKILISNPLLQSTARQTNGGTNSPSVHAHDTLTHDPQSTLAKPKDLPAEGLPSLGQDSSAFTHKAVLNSSASVMPMQQPTLPQATSLAHKDFAQEHVNQAQASQDMLRSNGKALSEQKNSKGELREDANHIIAQEGQHLLQQEEVTQQTVQESNSVLQEVKEQDQQMQSEQVDESQANGTRRTSSRIRKLTQQQQVYSQVQQSSQVASESQRRQLRENKSNDKQITEMKSSLQSSNLISSGKVTRSTRANNQEDKPTSDFKLNHKQNSSEQTGIKLRPRTTTNMQAASSGKQGHFFSDSPDIRNESEQITKLNQKSQNDLGLTQAGLDDEEMKNDTNEQTLEGDNLLKSSKVSKRICQRTADECAEIFHNFYHFDWSMQEIQRQRLSPQQEMTPQVFWYFVSSLYFNSKSAEIFTKLPYQDFIKPIIQNLEQNFDELEIKSNFKSDPNVQQNTINQDATQNPNLKQNNNIIDSEGLTGQTDQNNNQINSQSDQHQNQTTSEGAEKVLSAKELQKLKDEKMLFPNDDSQQDEAQHNKDQQAEPLTSANEKQQQPSSVSQQDGKTQQGAGGQSSSNGLPPWYVCKLFFSDNKFEKLKDFYNDLNERVIKQDKEQREEQRQKQGHKDHSDKNASNTNNAAIPATQTRAHQQEDQEYLNQINTFSNNYQENQDTSFNMHDQPLSSNQKGNSEQNLSSIMEELNQREDFKNASLKEQQAIIQQKINQVNQRIQQTQQHTQQIQLQQKQLSLQQKQFNLKQFSINQSVSSHSLQKHKSLQKQFSNLSHTYFQTSNALLPGEDPIVQSNTLVSATVGELSQESLFDKMIETAEHDYKHLQDTNRCELQRLFEAVKDKFSYALETKEIRASLQPDQMSKQFLGHVDPYLLQDQVQNPEWYFENTNPILLNVRTPSFKEKDYLKHIELTQQRYHDQRCQKILQQLDLQLQKQNSKEEEEQIKQQIYQNRALRTTQEDAQCAICNNGDYDDDNQIVFCEVCKITVHQQCYGIETVPEEEWICNNCQIFGKKRGMMVNCLLCPKKGGAMKPSNIFTKFEHIQKVQNIQNIISNFKSHGRSGHHSSGGGLKKSHGSNAVQNLIIQACLNKKKNEQTQSMTDTQQILIDLENDENAKKIKNSNYKTLFVEKEDRVQNLSKIMERELEFQKDQMEEAKNKLTETGTTEDQVDDIHDDYQYLIKRNEHRLGTNQFLPSPTETLYEWVHLSCATWLPGPQVTPKTPIKLNKLDTQRFNLLCSICGQGDTGAGQGAKAGACIQCQHPGCTTSFHVECARRASYYIDVEKKQREKTYKIYCEVHRPMKIINEIEEKEKQAVEEIQKFAKIIEKGVEIDQKQCFKLKRNKWRQFLKDKERERRVKESKKNKIKIQKQNAEQLRIQQQQQAKQDHQRRQQQLKAEKIANQQEMQLFKQQQKQLQMYYKFQQQQLKMQQQKWSKKDQKVLLDRVRDKFLQVRKMRINFLRVDPMQKIRKRQEKIEKKKQKLLQQKKNQLHRLELQEQAIQQQQQNAQQNAPVDQSGTNHEQTREGLRTRNQQQKQTGFLFQQNQSFLQPTTPDQQQDPTTTTTAQELNLLQFFTQAQQQNPVASTNQQLNTTVQNVNQNQQSTTALLSQLEQQVSQSQTQQQLDLQNLFQQDDIQKIEQQKQTIMEEIEQENVLESEEEKILKMDEIPMFYKLGVPAYSQDVDWTITHSRNDFPWVEIKFDKYSAKDCYEKYTQMVNSLETFIKLVIGNKDKYKKIYQSQMMMSLQGQQMRNYQSFQNPDIGAQGAYFQITHGFTDENMGLGSNNYVNTESAATAQLFCRCKGRNVNMLKSQFYVGCENEDKCVNGGWLHPECTTDLKFYTEEQCQNLENWYCEDCRSLMSTQTTKQKLLQQVPKQQLLFTTEKAVHQSQLNSPSKPTHSPSKSKLNLGQVIDQQSNLYNNNNSQQAPPNNHQQQLSQTQTPRAPYNTHQVVTAQDTRQQQVHSQVQMSQPVFLIQTQYHNQQRERQSQQGSCSKQQQSIVGVNEKQQQQQENGQMVVQSQQSCAQIVLQNKQQSQCQENEEPKTQQADQSNTSIIILRGASQEQKDVEIEDEGCSEKVIQTVKGLGFGSQAAVMPAHVSENSQPIETDEKKEDTQMEDVEQAQQDKSVHHTQSQDQKQESSLDEIDDEEMLEVINEK